MTRKTSFQSPSTSRHYLSVLKNILNPLFDNEGDISMFDAHYKNDKNTTSPFYTHALLLAVIFAYSRGITTLHGTAASAPRKYYLNSIISRYLISFHYHC
jgi:hypothetical protein